VNRDDDLAGRIPPQHAVRLRPVGG
jgi:hypothetical protein